MTQDDVAAKLVRKGFRWVNTLSDGSQVLQRKQGPVRLQAEVDSDGFVNGMDVDEYLKQETASTDRMAVAKETKRRSKTAMRDRLTAHSKEAAEVLREIVALEKRLAVDDGDIESKADELAKEEKTVVSNPQGVQLKDVGDQNAKANANWPVEDKMAVASALVKLANAVLADDDDEDEEEKKDDK